MDLKIDEVETNKDQETETDNQDGSVIAEKVRFRSNKFSTTNKPQRLPTIKEGIVWSYQKEIRSSPLREDNQYCDDRDPETLPDHRDRRTGTKKVRFALDKNDISPQPDSEESSGKNIPQQLLPTMKEDIISSDQNEISSSPLSEDHEHYYQQPSSSSPSPSSPLSSVFRNFDPNVIVHPIYWKFPEPSYFGQQLYEIPKPLENRANEITIIEPESIRDPTSSTRSSTTHDYVSLDLDYDQLRDLDFEEFDCFIYIAAVVMLILLILLLCLIGYYIYFVY